MWEFELKVKMNDGCKISCAPDIASLISKSLDFDADIVWSMVEVPNQEVKNDGN